MARVNLAYKRAIDKVYRQIAGAMGMKRVKQYQIAQELGLHKTTVSEHFKHHTFSFDQLIQIFDFLGMEFTLCVKD